MKTWEIVVCIVCMVSVSSIAKRTKNPCRLVRKSYGHVCLNDEEYCDSLETPEPKSNNEYVLVTSSKEKDRFTYKTGKFNSCENCADAVIKIDSTKTYQEMKGFGGGYTGTVTFLVSHLSQNMQKCLFKSYFSDSFGMGYSYIRVPIGGCDFDLSPWAYNEYPENDVNLSNFTKLDIRDLIRNEQIRELKRISKNDVKVLAVNWGPPKWMKEKNHWDGGEDNQLKPEYYQTWANYHVNWLQLMSKNGIDIWALSTGNEPRSARLINFQTLSWSAENQAKWIADNLGPTIQKSEFSSIELHAFDDNRDVAPEWIDRMENSSSNALKYVSGIEFHTYADKSLKPAVLDFFQNRFPDKQIWYTESCFGAWFMTKYIGPRLGAWIRAEKLVDTLMENLCHSTVGFIDWNLILNHKGGPSYVNNHVDAQIILNEDNTEMYKQPTFYAMAHFSKFILPGSFRIDAKVKMRNSTVNAIAFLRPDDKVALIIYNRAKQPVRVTVEVDSKRTINVKLKAKSINTLVYNDSRPTVKCSKAKNNC